MITLDPFIEAWELRELARSGDLEPRDIADFYLARIEQLNPTVGAYMTITAERAREDAARLETRSAAMRELPLFGIPYSLKDLTPTRGIRTTLGSANYRDSVPPEDAEIATRMHAAGGMLLGKTSTPEFGGRPTTEGGLCGIAHNPWHLDYNAGGSSGGAAAQIAAGLGPLAEGSDGGGSIRGPSSNCGVVGIKPSRGRISYAPHRGEGWGGFATRGPIARTVRDAALMLDVLAGPVVGDPYWPAAPHRPFADAIDLKPRGLHLAAITRTALGDLDPDVAASFESACATMRALGHRVDPIALDPGAMLLDCARSLICVGIAAIPVANLDLVDPMVREMFHHGERLSATEYVNLIAVMHNTARSIVQALAPYDATLTPTMTMPPMRNGSFPTAPDRYLEELWTWIAFEYPVNATGQPAVTLPAGFSRMGLPIGLQIIGRPAGEFELIALAAQYEDARPWRHLRPRAIETI